ncbi:hypothetical protein AMTR_s02611p00010010 [Amborella trichopoda]|uniref:Uncharacterized protein n=1 Tax=Amborella trichopoda TaxID=13333 RepID=U5CVJ9_AMBTC|nr:hypothetical protein AMTR_s02611p00010010 [Amborella trichopoda]
MEGRFHWILGTAGFLGLLGDRLLGFLGLLGTKGLQAWRAGCLGSWRLTAWVLGAVGFLGLLGDRLLGFLGLLGSWDCLETDCLGSWDCLGRRVSKHGGWVPFYFFLGRKVSKHGRRKGKGDL